MCEVSVECRSSSQNLTCFCGMLSLNLQFFSGDLLQLKTGAFSLSLGILSAGCQLRTLDLAFWGVEMNSSITVLDLSENSIGVSGANWIAKALAHNRSLQTLNINKTMCTHYGLKAI